MADATDLPPVLMQQLQDLKPVLERQGVVQLHRQSYRLRYRLPDGDLGSVHRSLLIGPAPEHADAVKALLERWRGECQSQEDERARARASKRVAEREYEVTRGLMLMEMTGEAGWRRRKQLTSWFDGLCNDPAAAIRFALSHELPEPRRPGRRCRSLWGHTSWPSTPRWLTKARARHKNRMDAQAAAADPYPGPAPAP